MIMQMKERIKKDKPNLEDAMCIFYKVITRAVVDCFITYKGKEHGLVEKVEGYRIIKVGKQHDSPLPRDDFQ